MRSAHILTLFMIVTLTGCNGFKVHNEGRLKIATETRKQAQELSEVNVFVPMEKNLDALTELENETRKLLLDAKQASYLKILPRRTGQQLARDLSEAVGMMQSNVDGMNHEVSVAVNNVNDQLDRQALVTDILKVKNIPALLKTLQAALKEETDGKKKAALENRIRLLTAFQSSEDPTVEKTLDNTLARIKNTLQWVNGKADKTIKAFAKIVTAADPASAAGSLSVVKDMAKDGGDKMGKAKTWLTEFSKPLQNAGQDENVVAAQKLFTLFVKEQLAGEQLRLEEYRRYLNEVKRVSEQFTLRQKLVVCKVYLPAFYRLYAVAENLKNFKTQYDKLKTGYNNPRERCAFALPGEKAKANDLADWGQGKNTLAEYLVAHIKRRTGEGKKVSGPKIIAGIAVIAYREGPYSDALYDQILIEKNRHAIRLSAINYGQRSDLIRDLASSLEIYEQSGFKAEDIADMILSATQIGALIFIGARQ